MSEYRSVFLFRWISWNTVTEYHQILYMHSYWQDLRWDCCASFFAHLYRSYGPWLTPKFRFRQIFLNTNWQNFTKFDVCIHIEKIYVGIVTHHFLPICTRIKALNWRHNFVSAWEQIDRILRRQIWICTVCLCPGHKKDVRHIWVKYVTQWNAM